MSFIGLQLYREVWLPNSKYKDESYFSVFGSVTNGIMITILNNIYSRVAIRLTKWENHETESSYQYSLILKTFSFQFVNSFLTLFYAAFVMRSMDELAERLISILVSKQIIDNIKEFTIPLKKVQRR